MTWMIKKMYCLILSAILFSTQYIESWAQSSGAISHSHTFTWGNKTISVHGLLNIVVHQNIEGPGSSTFEKIYFCTMDSGDVVQKQLLNSSQGWNFPVQDTNLTLVYPSRQFSDKVNKNYLITSFKVTLTQDSPSSQGYVVSGGVMYERITLNLLSRKVTNLGYEFELYGLTSEEISPHMIDSVQCS